MTLRILRPILGLGACLQAACFFQSETPLGSAKEGILETAFFGTWHCVSPKDSGDTATLLLAAFDEKQYFVEWTERDDVSHYRMYSTKVGQERVLNAQPLASQPDNTAWVFLKLRIGGDGRLVVDMVDEDAMKGLKGKKALAEIKRRVADPTLFSRFADCSREEG